MVFTPFTAVCYGLPILCTIDLKRRSFWSKTSLKTKGSLKYGACRMWRVCVVGARYIHVAGKDSYTTWRLTYPPLTYFYVPSTSGEEPSDASAYSSTQPSVIADFRRRVFSSKTKRLPLRLAIWMCAFQWCTMNLACSVSTTRTSLKPSRIFRRSVISIVCFASLCAWLVLIQILSKII